MLKTLELQNFTVFKEARLDFSSGLNVIIGENGTGKSHLLKAAYAMLQAVILLKKAGATEDPSLMRSVVATEKLFSIFSCNPGLLVRNRDIDTPLLFTITLDDGWRFSFEQGKANSGFQVGKETSLSTLFIPTKEILSIYKGFRSTLKNRELAFDGTYLDLAEALDLPPFRGDKLEDVRPLFEPLEKILHARVEQENGEFFFAAQGADAEKTERRIHAQLVAEGHRKLGMLSYLIKNGSLRKGTSLFWDEPEANLNPRLLLKLAQVLVELSKILQVTIATHSLFLLRELEILQEKRKLQKAHYVGLHFADDGGVEVLQGDTSNDIGDIAALDANLDQSDRYMNLSYGDA